MPDFDTDEHAAILRQLQEVVPKKIPTYLEEEIGACLDMERSSFLEAELAFYHRNYSIALAGYLDATGIPKYQFYCYRAAAFLAYENGELTRALALAIKGIKIYPDDALLQELIESLKMDSTSMPPKGRQGSQRIDLKQMHELTLIFEGHEEESLFSNEKPLRE